MIGGIKGGERSLKGVGRGEQEKLNEGEKEYIHVFLYVESRHIYVYICNYMI